MIDWGAMEAATIETKFGYEGHRHSAVDTYMICAWPSPSQFVM